MLRLFLDNVYPNFLSRIRIVRTGKWNLNVFTFYKWKLKLSAEKSTKYLEEYVGEEKN